MLKKYLGRLISFVKKNPKHSSLLLTAITLWTSIILFGSKFYADEKYHYRQIGMFWKGRYEIIPMLTTIPGYHATISLFMSLTDDLSVMKARIVSFLFSLICLFVFYLIAKKQPENKDPVRKVLQFAFLPISFIYFPMVYTDLFSTLLVLLAFYFVIQKRFHLAAIISIVSITSRQNNIVWLVFLWMYSYFSIYRFSISLKIIFEHLRKTFLFPIGILAFGVFVWLNGSIAVGDKGSHQAGFYLGNIYFFLAIVGVLFLPVLVSKINKKSFQSKSFLFFGIGIGLLLALSFLFFPPVLHGYNFDTRFLRNIILTSIYQKYIWAYAIAIFLGYLSLYMMKLEKHAYIFYPFVFLYLLPSWLIEQRYAIVPLALLLLFRKEEKNHNEWILVYYFILLSLCLFSMIMGTKIFF